MGASSEEQDGAHLGILIYDKALNQQTTTKL
jgi:hypothetical protein